MIEERAFFLTIHVILEKREDGGLRAFSDDIPGLILSNENPDLVLQDIVPALEMIVRQNFDLNLKFRMAQTPSEYMSGDKAKSRSHRTYVAPLPIAA
jgi:rRNA maturation protein Rpf1